MVRINFHITDTLHTDIVKKLMESFPGTKWQIIRLDNNDNDKVCLRVIGSNFSHGALDVTTADCVRHIVEQVISAKVNEVFHGLISIPLDVSSVSFRTVK